MDTFLLLICSLSAFRSSSSIWSRKLNTKAHRLIASSTAFLIVGPLRTIRSRPWKLVSLRKVLQIVLTADHLTWMVLVHSSSPKMSVFAAEMMDMDRKTAWGCWEVSQRSCLSSSSHCWIKGIMTWQPEWGGLCHTGMCNLRRQTASSVAKLTIYNDGTVCGFCANDKFYQFTDIHKVWMWLEHEHIEFRHRCLTGAMPWCPWEQQHLVVVHPPTQEWRNNRSSQYAVELSVLNHQ